MQHPNSLIDNHEHSDVSPWGNVDDVTWQAIAEKLQSAADERAGDATELPVAPIRPIAGSLTPVVLDPKPRLVAEYRVDQPPIGNEATAPHPEYTPWWEEGGFHQVAKLFHEPIFKDIAPDEEFVVGQGERSMRIFNFGEPLSAERQEDLKQFADIATQFMGDRAYDFISDVIIGEFRHNAHDPKNDTHSNAGFGWGGRGVVLINSAILPNDAPADETATGSSFLQTLLHEFGGHLVHGDIENDSQARADLEQFAEAVGWDLSGMKEDSHDWNAKGADNRPYAPHHAAPNAISMSPGGSPTEYGTANPKETFGETSKHMMVGSKVLDIMSETNDAWLDTFQKRLLKPGETMGDRPVATSLERGPIHITRYTGEAIRYPWQAR
jgi:hypothetical protein